MAPSGPFLASSTGDTELKVQCRCRLILTRARVACVLVLEQGVKKNEWLLEQGAKKKKVKRVCSGLL